MIGNGNVEQLPSILHPRSSILGVSPLKWTARMFRILLMIAGLALLTAAVYWPVHRFDFVEYDDASYLDQNPHVRQGITAAGLKDAFVDLRYDNYDPPLATISFELDQNLLGLRPGPMHVENVLLHLLAGLLLLRLLFVATGKLNLSVAVAALFLCHPMHVESVAWISERKDVLSIPLLLAAMLAYMRFCRMPAGARRWLMYGLLLVLFTLSLLAKAMGVTLPAVLLLLDFWPLRRWPTKPWLWLGIEKVPLVLIAAIVSMVQFVAQAQIGASGSLAQFGLMDRISNAIVCYCLYIVKLAVPTNLAVFYPHPGSRPVTAVIAAAGVLALVSVICWRLRHRMPYALVGWLWFVGTLVPVIGLVPGRNAGDGRPVQLSAVDRFADRNRLGRGRVRAKYRRSIDPGSGSHHDLLAHGTPAGLLLAKQPKPSSPAPRR